ncbi:MAG: radical SAM protein [Candidatus Thermoplasmatota archaeon]
MDITEMKKGSAYTGSLPEGCERCAEGGKLVLLVTGKCDAGCWYCPLSEKKMGKDVIYANERKVGNKEDILEEARSIDATGTGITGGGPLSEKPERTFEYIEMLKSEFGNDHHIHLYTRTTDIDAIRRAYESGLDEIRFHPPLKEWGRIEKTEYPAVLKRMKEEMDIYTGLEIPSVPGKKEDISHMLKEVEKLVDFVNLNELEFSSTNTEALKKRGYEHKSDVSSAVKGSQELALNLLEEDFGTSLHYCSLAFKDGVQLTNRIRRRAENTAKEGDIITEEGTLIRGMIETDEGESLAEELRRVYEIPEEYLWYEEEKDRIECSLALLQDVCGEVEEKCYGVEIYPTDDSLEVERWPLDRSHG